MASDIGRNKNPEHSFLSLEPACCNLLEPIPISPTETVNSLFIVHEQLRNENPV